MNPYTSGHLMMHSKRLTGALDRSGLMARSATLTGYGRLMTEAAKYATNIK